MKASFHDLVMKNPLSFGAPALLPHACILRIGFRVTLKEDFNVFVCVAAFLCDAFLPTEFVVVGFRYWTFWCRMRRCANKEPETSTRTIACDERRHETKTRTKKHDTVHCSKHKEQGVGK